jgi:hypothetical protein
MPEESPNPLEKSEKEWEKALESMQNFDTILIDLRKYGFTIISALIGSELFFGLTLGIQNAILLTTATLIVVIYWLDLYYRNALSGGLLRSIFLEIFRLEGGLTYVISNLYAKTKAEYFIVLLYAGLFLTSVFVAVALNNARSLEAKNMTDIPMILYTVFNTPFNLVILMVGGGFIFTMYLTSRKRRRTFSQTMKVYDYFETLAHESGRIQNIEGDMQRVVLKISQEKDHRRYKFTMPIGPAEKDILESKTDLKYYSNKIGKVATLFLAERDSWRKTEKPDHYWIIISRIDILMLNTIGTLDRPKRQEIFHFDWDENEAEPFSLADKLAQKKIIPEHCETITDIYATYYKAISGTPYPI